MQIRFLKDESIEKLHQAFTEAFADYLVDLPMPYDRFTEMIKARDLNPEYSIGAYDGDKLVSFIINGYRETIGKKMCYDGGSGTIPEYRKQGLSSQLLRKLIEELPKYHIDKYLLEVVEDNTTAINIYKKHGFNIVRKLYCLKAKKESFKNPAQHTYIINTDSALYENLSFKHYHTFAPTWQNTKQAILNIRDNNNFVFIMNEENIVGYGVIHKDRGEIHQIGVHKDLRRKGIGTVIINELAKVTNSEELIILNLDNRSGEKEFFEKIGFEKYVNQFEMEYDFMEHKSSKNHVSSFCATL